MVQSKQELYDKVSMCIGWDAFNIEIEKRYNDFGTLLDKETIALLLVDEMGKNIEHVLSILDLHPGIEATIIGTISYIEPVHTFQRKNGKSGQYVRIGLSDKTGNCILILWNQDTNLLKSTWIQPGSTVKIINGYTKKGYQGVEIHMGTWSTLEQVNSPLPTSKDPSSDNRSTMKLCGVIQSIEPTQVFFKDDGSYGFVAILILKTNEGMKEVSIWDDQVKQLKDFKQGDAITIAHLDIRIHEKTTQYHANGKALLQKKKG
jgi:ssDNA-binding replication factor A large subunit